MHLNHVFRFVAPLFFLFTSCQLFAQYQPVQGYWEGDWGGSHPFNIFIEIGEEGAVKATITWQFENESDGGQPLIIAKEFVAGVYNIKTGILTLTTTGEDDPYGRIVSGYYFLKMQESGAVMKGFTTFSKDSPYHTEIVMSRLRA